MKALREYLKTRVEKDIKIAAKAKTIPREKMPPQLLEDNLCWVILTKRYGFIFTKWLNMAVLFQEALQFLLQKYWWKETNHLGKLK